MMRKVPIDKRPEFISSLTGMTALVNQPIYKRPETISSLTDRLAIVDQPMEQICSMDQPIDKSRHVLWTQ